MSQAYSKNITAIISFSLCNSIVKQITITACLAVLEPSTCWSNTFLMDDLHSKMKMLKLAEAKSLV